MARIIVLITVVILISLILLKKVSLGYLQILMFFPIYLLFQQYFKINQNGWDDLAYHIPIELMIRDSGSLWNWPDIIYAQWGLVGGDVSNTLYAIAFNEFQFDRLNSLLAFIILIILAFSFKSTQVKVTATIVFLSVPALLQQVGTRYVDALLAWALFVVFILIWSQKKANPLNQLNIFLIFVSISFSLSIKYSAIIPVFLLCIYLYFKSRSNVILIATVSVVAFLTAVGPIWIRNHVSHDNFLYPYYLTDNSTGYMQFSSTTNILNSLYKNSIGMSNKSDLSVFIYQYIISPFETSYFLVQQTLFNTVSDFPEIYYKVFTYDNRLGGFGPAIILLIVLIISKYGLKSIPTLLILFLITSQMPVIIHPRYHFIIFTILVFIAFRDFEKTLKKKYLFVITLAFMSVVTLFAVANTYEYFKRISSPTNFSQTAQIINPDCLNVIKLGSDIWFGANLWGPNYCGKVLSGNFVYNKEIGLNSIGAGLEIPKQPNLEMNEFTEILGNIELEKKSTLVVCVSSVLDTNTVRKLNLLDPCEVLIRKLDQKDYKIMVGEIFEETFDGPLLQILKIEKVSKT
jgi:hypothetical protein